MPQMAPLWWETLFIMFISMFIIMNMIIYYNKNLTSPKVLKKNVMNNEFKWKW
uniref:ATP synthase complex subunit 8 n=1 Tax=Riptortus pedestris TaxID=329032 RepID=B7SMM1_RIPPE|nr:ATP synthase F0 subunit 8 [Riptortus pedestris]ABZ02115.1 ATP synthase F0 subunit 8 [Riptortus pedestris]